MQTQIPLPFVDVLAWCFEQAPLMVLWHFPVHRHSVASRVWHIFHLDMNWESYLKHKVIYYSLNCPVWDMVRSRCTLKIGILQNPFFFFILQTWHISQWKIVWDTLWYFPSSATTCLWVGYRIWVIHCAGLRILHVRCFLRTKTQHTEPSFKHLSVHPFGTN